MDRLGLLDDALESIIEKHSSLRQRLGALRDEHPKISPTIYQQYERLVERMKIGLSDTTSPDVGDPFPNFILTDEQGTLVSLTDVLEDGFAVFSFNRGHWCHYCRLELQALREASHRFKENGARVVCVVPDRQKYSKKLRDENELPFSVLTDIDHSLGLELGLVVSIGEELRDLYLERGIDLSEAQGNDGWFIPVPADYIVDKSGIIRARLIEPDFRFRTEPDGLIETLKQVADSSPY